MRRGNVRVLMGQATGSGESRVEGEYADESASQIWKMSG